MSHGLFARSRLVASCLLMTTAIALVMPPAVWAQGRRGGGGGAPGTAQGRGGPQLPGPDAPVIGQVRVPKRSTNIHSGPSTAQIVVVNVPQGTVLNVLERRGPWLCVELTPKLRETGTPMRWYRNETRGFVHTSTVEAVPAPPAR